MRYGLKFQYSIGDDCNSSPTSSMTEGYTFEIGGKNKSPARLPTSTPQKPMW